MNRTWTSYVLLTIGLIMFLAADRTNADDKQTAHTVNSSSEQTIEIFVNKEGDDDSEIKVSIDGAKYDFTMPELNDGEERTITTSDGKTIRIKSVSGNKMLWIDGNKLHLPSLSDETISSQGLSALIARSHQFKSPGNNISISGHGLSEDVKKAIVGAVEGVLTSYDVDKKVQFRDNQIQLHVMSDKVLSGKDGGLLVKVDAANSDDKKRIMILRSEVEVEVEEDEQH